jgi:hypothetical protein
MLKLKCLAVSAAFTVALVLPAIAEAGVKGP